MSKFGADCELERKYAVAERMFANFLDDTYLSRILAGFSEWAVVGGAVRDVLLSDNPSCRGVAPPWTDLDIAVAHTDRETVAAALMTAFAPFDVKLNSFGGVKATLPGVGNVDLWVTGKPAPLGGQDRHEYWVAYLNEVDFGINAVAFTWPGRNLVVHPRWLEDIKSSRVELLSARSPRKELQPLRAIALGAALTCRLDRPIHLGDAVWVEIDWLLEGSEHMCSAVSYLRNKLAVGRWKKDHLLHFLAILIEHPDHAIGDRERLFLEGLQAIVEHEPVR